MCICYTHKYSPHKSGEILLTLLLPKEFALILTLSILFFKREENFVGEGEKVIFSGNLPTLCHGLYDTLLNVCADFVSPHDSCK